MRHVLICVDPPITACSPAFLRFHASPKSLYELTQLLRRETDVVRFNVVKATQPHVAHVRLHSTACMHQPML